MNPEDLNVDRDVPDVFGIYKDAMTGLESVVIVKSKAIRHMIEHDGMTEEDAEGNWDYNIAGSLGRYQYSVIDDMVDSEIIADLVDEGGIYDPRYPEKHEDYVPEDSSDDGESPD